MPEFVRLEVADGVGTIRVDRPKMNAPEPAGAGRRSRAAAEEADRSATTSGQW